MQGRRLVDWARRHSLVYVAAAFCVWLGLWEGIARLDKPFESPLEQLAATGFPLADAAEDAANEGQPRLLILGNSQIHSVRDRSDVRRHGFPTRLRERLAEQGVATDVADLSAGGQQVTESLALLLDSFDRVRPDHVLLGVGLVNLQPAEIRPQLVRSCDWDRIHERLRASVPTDVSTQTRARLTELLMPEGVSLSAHAPTIQEQLDERLAAWLRGWSAAVRNRDRMYDRLIHRPIQRDLQKAFRREVRQDQLAMTVAAGPDHDAALAAVRAMAAFCDSRRVSMTVVLMPFDDNGTPRAYADEDEKQLRGDLETLAMTDGFRVLDVSRLLGPEHFGEYTDGSRDCFHFKASGHALLGAEVARRLGPRMEGARIVEKSNRGVRR